MDVPQIIVLICWVIFLIYWVGNSRNVKPAQETNFPGRNFRWLGLAILAILLANHFVTYKALQLPLCQMDIAGCHYHNLAITSPVILIELLGVVLAVSGLIIAIVARKTLADNWSVTIDLKKGHKLITTGIYSYMRHPIYSGVLLMALGNVLVFQTFFVGLVFILLLISFLSRIKNEERLMNKTFPEEYKEYMKQTKRLIPGLF